MQKNPTSIARPHSSNHRCGAALETPCAVIYQELPTYITHKSRTDTGGSPEKHSRPNIESALEANSELAQFIKPEKRGYGRELSHFDLRELTTAQAVWAKTVD